MKYFLKTLLFLLMILTTTVNAAEVTLGWNKVEDPIVQGYIIYAGFESRIYNQPLYVGDVSEYHLVDVPENRDIFFAVTAHDKYGNESDYSEELPCFSIVLSKTGNGLVDPNTTTINSLGSEQTFSFYPSTDYSISDIKVDGAYAGKPTTYTFFNIDTSHTLSVNFTPIINPPQDTYTITVTTSVARGSGGYVLPSTVTVNSGESQKFTFIVTKRNTLISDVIIDNRSFGPLSSYTFSNITADHTLSVVFKRK